MRFNTKKAIALNLSSINDFPKLDKEEIQNNILFGSFQLKQSESYICDMIRNGKAYMIIDKIPKKLKSTEKNYKIIGIEIYSRHKRSEKVDSKSNNSKKFRTIYKVFVKYLPNQNTSKAILGLLIVFFF